MSTTLSILGNGYGSFGQHLLRSVKSTHIRHFLFFYLIMTTLANHFGYCIGLIMPTSNSLFTSAFTASARSVDIFLSFCFLGFEPWAIFRL